LNVPDKAAIEWAVRVYKVPAGFRAEPIACRGAQGSRDPFVKSLRTPSLKDGKLTVRNTKPNLELIEAWIDSLTEVRG
jgi:hypothetical protein